MYGKQKRIVLSLGGKVKKLKRLKNDEAGTKLTLEYDVGKSVILEIKRNRDFIINFISALESEQGSLGQKTMNISSDDKS